MGSGGLKGILMGELVWHQQGQHHGVLLPPPGSPPKIPYLVQDPRQAVKQHLEEAPLVKLPLGGATVEGPGGRGPPPRGRPAAARLDLGGRGTERGEGRKGGLEQ